MRMFNMSKMVPKFGQNLQETNINSEMSEQKYT